MTFDPNCKHDRGVYFCDTPRDPEYWARWCCALRCGHSFVAHPVTGMSYPRKAKEEKKLPPLSEGGKL